jgi:ubiquinone/menaquinone biosynthesis C-methylase UbiE
MPHRHGVTQQADHPDQDALIRWAGIYDLGMRVWGRRGRQWRARVVDRLELQPGQRALDVASGTGRLAFELAARVVAGGRVDGVDAASEMVDYATRANKRLKLPVTFQTAAAQQLPFPDGTFDAVTCTLALHHIAAHQRQLAVDEMHRVLKPGGRLLIADLQAPTHRGSGLAQRLFRHHAMDEQPVDQAITLMTAAGFANVIREQTKVSWIGQAVGTKVNRPKAPTAP